MANPVRGEAALKVGDQTYTLVFDINALCEVEYVLDLPINGILRKLQNVETAPLNVVRALLWGGLRRYHAGLSLADAGNIIEGLGGVGQALTVMGEAMASAFPTPEEDPGSRPQKGAAAGTGRRSSNRGSQQASTAISSGA